MCSITYYYYSQLTCSVSPVNIISVSYNKHEISIYKITVQECKIKPLGYIWFPTAIHKDIKY